ncbi:RGS domain-containing protein [Syncephalis fuscata]|nr:RGS domain-containing protein [Syncephalis fuscata]
MEGTHHTRRHCSSQTREELSKIYEAFLQNGAPLEVNIPHRMRNAIDERVRENNWSPNMFEEARWEVWRLMYRHTYPRYTRHANSRK